MRQTIVVAGLPENLTRLREAEEELRLKSALRHCVRSPPIAAYRNHRAGDGYARHVASAPPDDEDLKVIQVLGIRIFNAFAASLKLALSGYSQNSAIRLTIANIILAVTQPMCEEDQVRTVGRN